LYRAFIDHPNPSAQTPTNDRHYVGAFEILTHASHGSHSDKHGTPRPSWTSSARVGAVTILALGSIAMQGKIAILRRPLDISRFAP
jgi:hypothetical protein